MTPQVRSWVLALLVGVAGCAEVPAKQEAVGERVTHPTEAFSVVVPPGWTSRPSRHGLSLVRELPYGGGYPSLSVRPVGPEDLPSLGFAGRRLKRPDGEAEYRYQHWSNTRGRGYRLEVLLRLNGTVLLIEAAVWDPAQRMDERFFDTEFWPIVNAVQAAR